MRSLSASIELTSICTVQGGGAADRLGRVAPDLRTGLRFLAAAQRLDELLGHGAIEVFIEVLADLEHRRVDAGAKTLDFHPAELSVGGQRVRLRMDMLLARVDEIGRAAQPAGRRRADLYQMVADRMQIEHRVESRDLEHAHVGHAE